jgi:purine-cytosine permease-like protein
MNAKAAFTFIVLGLAFALLTVQVDVDGQPLTQGWFGLKIVLGLILAGMVSSLMDAFGLRLERVK